MAVKFPRAEFAAKGWTKVALDWAESLTGQPTSSAGVPVDVPAMEAAITTAQADATAALAAAAAAQESADDAPYLTPSYQLNPTEVLAITSTATPYIGVDPPSDPIANPLWWNSEEGRLKVYYNDGTSSQWVDASPGVPGPVSTTPGPTGAVPWATTAAWVTATAYTATAPASTVTSGGSTYVCLIAHTSGTFATDLAAAKWLLVASKGEAGAAGGGSGDANPSLHALCGGL